MENSKEEIVGTREDDELVVAKILCFEVVGVTMNLLNPAIAFRISGLIL